LFTALGSEKSSADASLTPGRLVEKSCRIVATEGSYSPGHRIDDEYANRWDATLVQRMAAAARFTAELNRSLVSR
jgi:hypothetical protein